MALSATKPRTRVAVIGLGQQGSGIAELLGRQGYELVGGVDIGPKVGKKISEFVPGVSGEGMIFGSLTELLNGVNHQLDVAVLAAAIDRATTLDQAREFLAAGVNVLTLHQDLFDPLPEWADELHALGKSTGASFLATGVQDTWWVQIPSVAAASTNNVRSVQIEHLIDMESIPVHIMQEWGVGIPSSEFGPTKFKLEQLPPILGAPLRVCAQAFGFEPDALSTSINPIVNDEPVAWKSGSRLLPPGSVIGTEEVTSFQTNAGVDFRGYLRVRPLLSGEYPTDIVTIDADPVLRLEHTPFPGQQVTNIALVARIPDILEASGGVHSAGTLGPAKYRAPITV